MKRMKLALCIVSLTLTGCFLFSSGPPSEVGRTPEELRQIREHIPPVYDAFPFGPVQQIRIGQWVKYETKEEGGGWVEIHLAVADRSEEGTWIEIIQDGSVSAQLVSSENLVQKAWFRLFKSEKGQADIFPQEVIQGRAAADQNDPSGDRSETKSSVDVGGEVLAVVVVEIEREDFQGRISTETSSWSLEVPGLYRGSSLGGLVAFSSSSSSETTRLIGYGEDYTPLIEKR